MPTSQTMVESCICSRLRAAARVISRRYDDALRPAELNSSQLGVLAAIDADPTASIAALSKRLHMDRTTLSRNLKPLEQMGLVKLGLEGWKRSKTVHLTKKGKERLKYAATLWQKAQDQFIERFGQSDWKGADRDLRRIATLFQ